MIKIDEFKENISCVSDKTLNSFLDTYKKLLTKFPSDSQEYYDILEAIKCIRTEISSRGMGNEGSSQEKGDVTTQKSESKGEESFFKILVKEFSIILATAIIWSPGLAHLEKHTNVFNGTFLEKFSKNNRYLYELLNDYSEFENRGEMEWIDPYYTYNPNNLNYDNGEDYRYIGFDCPWETLSIFCYGTPAYARHLQLYNAYYDPDTILHKGDLVFIPNPNQLEEHIYTKKIMK